MSFLSKPIESFSNWMSPMTRKKHVYQFKEGSMEDKDILSSKGAHICELARTAGMPVPKGFILSTEASMQFQSSGGTIGEAFFGEVVRAVADMERESGKKFNVANAADPLFLCLRSGALVSVTEQAHSSIGAPESWKVPGVMNSLLGIGFNDAVADNLCGVWGEHAALNAYAHFLMTYGMLIFGVSSARYHGIIKQITHTSNSAVEQARRDQGLGGAASGETGTGSACPSTSYRFTPVELRTMIAGFKKVQAVPADGFEQLKDALTRLYGAWFSDVSVTYRDNLDMYRGSGIAVIVSEQILGGSGLFSTRSPLTGEPGLFGFYWPEASGSKIDMVAFREQSPVQYRFLEEARSALEAKFADMQDVEFAVDAQRRVWVLNSMPGHRRPAASMRIAKDLVAEGMLTERQALAKIDPAMIGNAHCSRREMVDASCAARVAGSGVASSDGVVTGHLAFSLDDVMGILATGRNAVLCRDDCDVNDIGAIKLSAAVITLRGSATSSTAIFCRGLNKVCVTGVCDMSLRHVDGVLAVLTARGYLHLNDEVSVNGSSGTVYAGGVEWAAVATTADFDYVMGLTDRYRKLQVFSHAQGLSDCQRALGHHADGVALLQTDWMFAEGASRLDLVRTIVFCRLESERRECSNALETLLVSDFKHIFRLVGLADAQKPVIIQLFNNDIEDFLPDNETELVEVATRMDLSVRSLKSVVTNFRYQARHSGVFGHRAYAMFPDLIRVQVRALIKAANETNLEFEQTASSASSTAANAAASQTAAAGVSAPFSPGAATGPGPRGVASLAGGSNRVVPLLSLPMTSSWEEVDRLAIIVKAVAAEFNVDDQKKEDCKDFSSSAEGVGGPSVVVPTTPSNEVLRYGLLVGTPRACIDIEEFLSRSEHVDVAFVTFQADTITEFMFGMCQEDCSSVSVGAPSQLQHAAAACGARAPPSVGVVGSRRIDPFSPGPSAHAAPSPDRHSDRSASGGPGKRKLHSSERNPFEHLDQAGVGHLLESTVRACRAVKCRGDDHLKLGVIGAALCSDPASIRFFNSLDINYIGCAPQRTEMACLSAAQAQIRHSATGSVPPPTVSDAAWDWYHTYPTSRSSGAHKESSSTPRFPWDSWDAPFVRYWKQAENESSDQHSGASPGIEVKTGP